MNATDLFGLADKGVLITGATSLMAVWTARLLLDVGARVVMTDRLEAEAMREAFTAYAEGCGDAELAIAGAQLIGGVDIRNRTNGQAAPMGKRSVFELVQQARGQLGQIDVLINVAGGQEPVPAAALSTEILRRTIDRILIGTWNVIHEVFEQSMREHGGRIVTVTADVDQGYPGMPAMGAARNGLTSMHKAMAVEWAPMGITCCVVAPGAADTPGLDRYPAWLGVRERGIAAALQNRLIDPREIGFLLTTLASPWARSVNGHSVVANGGDSLVTPLYGQLVAAAEGR